MNAFGYNNKEPWLCDNILFLESFKYEIEIQ